jgi:hypothetical protein
MLDAVRRAVGVPAQARWMLGLSIVAKLAANVTHGLTGAAVGAVGAWPAAAFTGSYELLIMIIRRAEAPEVVPPHADVSMTDPLRERQQPCSKLNRQPIVFPRYAVSVLRSISASRAHSDCASTLPQSPEWLVKVSLRKGDRRTRAMSRRCR